MNYRLRIFIAVFVCVLTTCKNKGAREENIYSIYYLPVNIETYMPVTPENIEEKAQYNFKVTSELIDKIFDFGKQCVSVPEDKKIKFLRTRIKILKLKKDAPPLYIDKSKYILREKKQCLMKEQLFMEIVNFLENKVKGR